ncbi:Hypothetical protein CINCED_3A000722 [Cinara cedri]|uniref:Uncharacterized protein n=1 Tax=Cinara cedri TaxID=506608 RepID=A0A5E4M3T7_9HEMI|nr:Hypothetical protein CINCED_3A000722 [Cinara cedri]
MAQREIYDGRQRTKFTDLTNNVILEVTDAIKPDKGWYKLSSAMYTAFGCKCFGEIKRSFAEANKIQELTRPLVINIKRIFEKLFNDKLLCSYSFHGIRAKKSFSSWNIYSVIIEAIRKDSMFCNIQDREIEDTIQKYLAQEPFVVKRNE